MADKLYRAFGVHDVVAIPIPAPPGALRTRRVRMYLRGGNDQAARDVARGGLNGYEAPLPALLIEAVRRFQGAFIDVGANTGLYALLAACARPHVDVHAFEPYPPVLEVLRSNVAINRPFVRVTLHATALSDNPGPCTLHLPPPLGSIIHTSASMDPDFNPPGGEVVAAQATTLDNFWVDAGQPRVGVLKVDTEGTEDRVLIGGREVVKRNRPLVVYELLPRARVDAIADFASELQYQDIRLHPDELIQGLDIAFDEDGWNHILVPIEKMSLLAEIAGRLGLGLRRM
ncbi:MAG TPA: FkbM family methyltransferase [Acidimicrobiales bacterium]|nr:FkbM family methyltransferase [Acidimicrobiales bacterium]